jgi:hypothetical protein
MKLCELFEGAASDYPVKKAVRIMKFSVRDGSNSAGIDLANTKCSYYIFNHAVYVGKAGEFEVGDSCAFENELKPGFSAIRNSKLTAGNTDKVKKISTDLKDALAVLKADRLPILIINPTLLKGVTAPEAKPVRGGPEDVDDGYFLLGYWGNPGRGGNEYFWSGVYADRDDAVKAGKYRLDRGQPKTMVDWVGGKTQVIRGKDKFLAAAKKVGLNPNVDNLSWE